MLFRSLGSAVVSQISVPDLTYAASYIESRNFRSFETCLIVTVAYLLLAIVLRQLLARLGRRLFAGRVPARAASTRRAWWRITARDARAVSVERP